jgi:hypothetical protein
MDFIFIAICIICLFLGMVLLIYNKPIGLYLYKHRNPLRLPDKFVDSLPWNPRVNAIVVGILLFLVGLGNLISEFEKWR